MLNLNDYRFRAESVALNYMMIGALVLAVAAVFVIPPVMLGYLISTGNDYVVALAFTCIPYSLLLVCGICRILVRRIAQALMKNDVQKIEQAGKCDGVLLNKTAQPTELNVPNVV